MVITLTGENSFLLNRELKKITNDFEKNHGDLAIERLDAEEAEYHRIYEAITALPFLVSKKLTIIYSPTSSKELCENIEKLLNEIPDSNEVILFQPKFDKRQSYFKILNKKTELREFKNVDPVRLHNWIIEYAREQGAKITDANARFLLERVGANQMMIANEIDKLSLYSNDISRDVINLLTEQSLQSTTFELLEAAFNKKPQKTIQIYKEQRLQKVEPQVIIGLLAWQLHAMAVVVAAGNRTVDEIVAKSNLKPYTINKTRAITRDMNLSNIADLINKLTDIDKKSKTKNYNLDEALAGYLLELSV